MPPRLSRSTVSAPKNKPKNQPARKIATKRSLHAFAIASAENPESARVARHRLGEVDRAEPSRKRQRLDEDDSAGEDSEEEEERLDRSRQRKRERRESGVNSSDEGSDSEGNNWTLGHVDEDDDSELDSDEAFGESDEERFEGWTFRASQSGKKAKKAKPSRRDAELNLNEDDSEEDEDSDDSLGEDAVDLATMLDQNSDDEDIAEEGDKQGKPFESAFDSEDDESMQEADDESHYSASDDEPEDGPRQQLQMSDLLSSLTPKEAESLKTRAGFDAIESMAPDDSAVAASQKLDISDLLGSGATAKQRKQAKFLRDDVKSTKRNGVPAKVEVPLPKRQQDKIDRVVANDKAKETLERWVDTVKHNRRAEHLSFPLQYSDAAEPMGAKKLMPSVAPTNALESTIQNILQESGLASTHNTNEEEQLRKFEELETKHLPVEEVEARRAELRKARELLFREELRAKRIKKIKSKSYRRVHRKERERNAEKERALLIADGVDLSEEDREANDRRRAEERMGAKHRESKWSKGVKQSGRAAWDEDARVGVTEMARRNEELRRRIQGKDARDDEFDSDVSSSESDDDESDGEKAARQLARVEEQDAADGSGSKLASMAFMRKADAARKAQNDEDVERMRRELAGEETPSEGSEDEARKSGRRKYGPKPGASISGKPKTKFSEFEEADEEEHSRNSRVNGEDEGEEEGSAPSRGRSTAKSSYQALENQPKVKSVKISSVEDKPAEASNPWLTASKKKDRSAKQAEVVIDTQLPVKARKAAKKASAGEEILSAPDADGFQTVTYGKGEDEEASSDNEGESLMPFVIRNQELVQKAFAGDDVVADFEKERREIAEMEDEKIIDDTLPGWGAWHGEGLTKREQKRNVGKVLRKQEGIRPEDRKDAKLKNVIINEKRNRKNAKYMASQLPFPFESRQQYERSLRLAKGPEWSTKQAFQDATKPRVMVKQGVILPPQRPLV